MTERVAIRYFSGTGNTEYAVRRFADALGDVVEDIVSIENDGAGLTEADTVVIAYPNYMCCLPKIMQDYLLEHLGDFEGKRVFTLVTYANFFFDCDLLVFRLLRKRNVGFTPVGSIAVQMPMNVCDMQFMKQTPDEEVVRRRDLADERLAKRARALCGGEVLFDGKESKRLAAFLRQRMFYGRRIGRYFDKLRINENCVGCGLCTVRCPLDNFEIENGKAVQKGRCTQCYRCVSLCPSKAITVMGKEVQWRYRWLASPSPSPRNGATG
jgi:ferredoxin